MMPDSIHAQSDVNINDSCNNCFCCQRRGKTERKGGLRSTRKKVVKKAEVIDLSKPLDTSHMQPMKRHTVTHIDATITQDDDVAPISEEKKVP